MAEKHISQMNKADLLLEAESIGLEVDPEATNPVLRTAIAAERERLAGLEPEAATDKPTAETKDTGGEDNHAPAPEPIVKSGGRKVRARGFFGLYKRALFLEDDKREYGHADDVDDETLAALREDYPAAEIEEL